MKLLELNKSPNLCRRSHQQLRLFPTTCRHLKAWWRRKATFPGKAASSGSNILVCMDRQHKKFTDLLSTPFGASKNDCPVPIPMSHIRHIHSGLREGAFDATCVLLRSCEGYTQFVCPMGVAAAGATGTLPYLEVATHPP